MSDEPQKRSRAWIGWMLLALPILYVLAAGPLEWMAARHLIGREPAVTIYAPLRWARNRSEPFRWAIDSYVDWFLRR